MVAVSRRAVLWLTATAAAGALAEAVLEGLNHAHGKPPAARRPLGSVNSTAEHANGCERPVAGENLISAENRRPGSQEWRTGARTATDDRRQIQGYASATSVNRGGTISFHVTVEREERFTVAIYRFGWYDGAGARLLTTSPPLRGTRQVVPEPLATTGLIACDWSPSWSLTVPPGWTPGLHLAVFTTASGWRGYTPFVVRDDRGAAPLCVILPFATYQAYNRWPADGRRGRSLYVGYPPSGPPDSRHRAFSVSFDRPYSDDGLPRQARADLDAVAWLERSGHDLCYATSIDLDEGRVDPTRHAGLVFAGHDEYWSRAMRDVAARAVAGGTGLAFLSANNLYWHVRLDRSGRVVTCYKTSADPAPDGSGATTQWRQGPPGPGAPEWRLLGVQYNGIVGRPAPLVVREADHWFWAGCGVRNGDRIPGIVAGEADGAVPDAPAPPGVTRTLVSASPYRTRDGAPQVQNSSVSETAGGAVVFAAGSVAWSAALNRPDVKDARIERATANVLERMVRCRPR